MKKVETYSRCGEVEKNLRLGLCAWCYEQYLDEQFCIYGEG